MDIARAFTYWNEDERWQSKLPITLILGVIPIVNFAVIGWMLDLVRNMLDGMEHPMPDWDDLGTQVVERWVSGLMTALAVLLYNIPLIIGSICFGIVIAAADSRFMGFVWSLISIAYVALAWMPLSIGLMRYSRTRDFSHYLQFGHNISLARENLSTLIVLAVFVFVVGFIISLFGRIPCLGWILSLFSLGVSAVLTGHLTGQAALEIARASQTDA